MKLLIAFALAAAIWLSIACVWCACLGSILWTFFAGEAVVLCLFIASREYDALQSDREWRDAKRHPRI